MNLIAITRILDGSSQRMISILGIGFVTMTILWALQYLKSRKLKEKIKQLENK